MYRSMSSAKSRRVCGKQTCLFRSALRATSTWKWPNEQRWDSASPTRLQRSAARGHSFLFTAASSSSGRRRNGQAIRSLSLHPLESHAFDDGGDAGADHHDVAEPGSGKRSARGGTGLQRESEEGGVGGRDGGRAARGGRG